MRRTAQLLALVACLLLAAPALAAGSAAWPAQVLKVKDGDGLVVSRPGRRPQDVRFWGVDAPEWNQPWGQEASHRLDRYVGMTLRFQTKAIDRYKRPVVVITLPDGQVLNHILAVEGHVWWWQKYAPTAWDIAEGMIQAHRTGRAL